MSDANGHPTASTGPPIPSTRPPGPGTATVQIGESFVGDGVNAAHLNTVLGDRTGPAGIAWATSLATPRQGFVPFVTVLRPSLPVRPFTLFVAKAEPASERHGLMIWGPAQAGVAGGVADAVASGDVTSDHAEQWVLIAAVWVNPQADDEEVVYRNNRLATSTALANGVRNLPTVPDMLAAKDSPFNPFYAGMADRR